MCRRACRHVLSGSCRDCDDQPCNEYKTWACEPTDRHACARTLSNQVHSFNAWSASASSASISGWHGGKCWAVLERSGVAMQEAGSFAGFAACLLGPQRDRSVNHIRDGSRALELHRGATPAPIIRCRCVCKLVCRILGHSTYWAYVLAEVGCAIRSLCGTYWRRCCWLW